MVKNLSHTLAYSLVALQEMNLAFKFPTLFWDCACLITDSGGVDDQNDELFEEENEEVVDIYESEDFEEYEYEDAPDGKTKIKKKRTRSTDYKKIATAIGKIKQSGVKIVPPNINKSSYTFTPDVENNQIIFGLSGILNVGEDIIIDTIKNRPYTSIKDYIEKVKPKKQSVISLIKGGAFDELMDRKICMGWYIWETCDKKINITLQNMGGLIKYDLLPKDTEEQITARRVYEFNRYLKSICKKDSNTYILDERAINFLTEIDCSHLVLENFELNAKSWDKVYQKWMDIIRSWINENKESILNEINSIVFLENWNKYAKGSYSAWEMEALCFYYHEHELANLDMKKYGISNFYSLPETPEVERVLKKGDKEINLFKLNRICGTCIAKDKAKATVSILTTDGVVNVKFRKEYFSLFDKQVSEVNADGTKTIKEKSWFNRGNMILITGIRSEDNFIAKKYSSTPVHQLYKINSINSDGTIEITSERYQNEEI